jgi:hypothetical protein
MRHRSVYGGNTGQLEGGSSAKSCDRRATGLKGCQSDRRYLRTLSELRLISLRRDLFVDDSDLP